MCSEVCGAEHDQTSCGDAAPSLRWDCALLSPPPALLPLLLLLLHNPSLAWVACLIDVVSNCAERRSIKTAVCAHGL